MIKKKSNKNNKSPKVTDNVPVTNSPKSEKKMTKLKKTEKILDIVDLQEKYNVTSGDIKKAVKGVIKFHSENPKLQNQLFQDRVPLFLQVSSHHVPKGKSRIIRLPLPNSILTPDDDVCLIVPELKGIKNIEHEKHVEYYEELLRKKGVENIKKIMTCHEFRTEHETFEQKSRLADLYDVFLVDGRISGRVVKKCGKIFYKKRKVPTAVRLCVSKLKEHIDKALSKVFFHMHLKGDSNIIQFGHNKMDIGDLADNVVSIIEGLNKEFPGGMENIKGIQVYTPRATSIPIYMSLKNPTEINVPKVAVKKPKAYKTYKGELSTRLNSDVTVRPRGDIIVKSINKEGISNINNTKEKKGNKKNLEGINQNKASNEAVEVEKDGKVDNGNNVVKTKKKKFKDTNDKGVKKATKKHKQNETTSGEVAKKKKKRYFDEESNVVSSGSQEVDASVSTKLKIKKTIKKSIEKKSKAINIGDKVKKNKLKKKVKQ